MCNFKILTLDFCCQTSFLSYLKSLVYPIFRMYPQLQPKALQASQQCIVLSKHQATSSEGGIEKGQKQTIFIGMTKYSILSRLLFLLSSTSNKPTKKVRKNVGTNSTFVHTYFQNLVHAHIRHMSGQSMCPGRTTVAIVLK